MATLDALEPQLVRLRAMYAKTPLPRFLAWWWRELLACLPARWRAALAERTEALLLETEGRTLVVRHQSGEAITPLGRIELDIPAEAQRVEFAQLQTGIDVPLLRLYYCIPAQRTLRRTLSLPAAAEERLRQVLVFEMDRQTPFKADQVYFDHRVIGRDASGRSLHVDLTVIPRAQLDAELAAISGLGAALDGVDCWRDREAATRLGINLLPAEWRARRRDLRLRLNLALAATAALLLAVVMVESVTNREQALAGMTEAVHATQEDAKVVSALRKTLDDTIDSANFLASKKRSTVTMVELLDDLSRRLPDSTYIERLNLNEDGRLEVQGLSDEAPKLINDLQQSELIANPAFQGVIQPDPQKKKDRFNLIAQVKPREARAPAHARPDGEVAPAAAGSKEEGHAPAAGSQ